MGRQGKDCRTQEQCKQIIIKKCLKGNAKACEVAKKGIEYERRV
jgi:hypothetical protein